MARALPGLLVIAGMVATSVGAFLFALPLGLLVGGGWAFLLGFALERAQTPKPEVER